MNELKQTIICLQDAKPEIRGTTLITMIVPGLTEL